MDNLTPLDIPEFHRFSGYLDAVLDLTSRGNYEAWFGVKGFNLTTQDFTPEGLLQAAYPDLLMEKEKIVECTISQMEERIAEGLKIYVHRIIEEDGPAYGVDLLQTNLLSGYLKHMKECIDYEQSIILEYDDDLVYFSIWWRFAFIIYDRSKRRCLIIHGGGSD